MIHDYLCMVWFRGNVMGARELWSSNESSAGYVESSKRTTQNFVMHCYTIVHDKAGKNNTLQWLSSFVSLYILSEYMESKTL